MEGRSIGKWKYWILHISRAGTDWEDMGQVVDCVEQGDYIKFFTQLHGSFTVSARRTAGQSPTEFHGRGDIYKAKLLPPRA